MTEQERLIQECMEGTESDVRGTNTRCLAAGTILAGKYLVGRVLGQGGFGITYLGVDLNLEVLVAVKEYFPVELVSRDTTSETGDRVLSLGGDKSLTYRRGLEKYVAEARNVSQFAGTPGVVSVKDFFYENETAYIVMEYIRGISLKDYLKRRGTVTEAEALAIMKPVLTALNGIHRTGVIHRDISPDNIMLTFADGAGCAASGDPEPAGDGASDAGAGPGEGVLPVSVSLIDFGAARMTTKNDQKSLTIILKHGYAPEEQYRTHGEQGPWTDVYAACAVFYRMLTGETPVSAMDRLFQDDLKPFTAFPVKVSGQIQNVLLAGLAVKKENRIQSIRELMAGLYEGKPVNVPEPEDGENGSESGKGNGKTGKSGSVDLFGRGDAAIGTVPEQYDKGKDTSQERGTGRGRALIAAAAVVCIFAVGGVWLAAGGKMAEQTGASAAETVAQVTENGGTETAVEIFDGRADENEAQSGAGAAASAVLEVKEQTEDIGPAITERLPRTSFSSFPQYHTLFCLSDGTVQARGSNEYGQCMVQDWDHITAVSAGYDHSLGLRCDGKVLSAGNDSRGQCRTEEWADIVAVAAGTQVSYGLKQDGTVLSCGNAAQVSDWTDIRAITVGYEGYGVIGLDVEGRLHFAGFADEMPEITGWQDVVWIVGGSVPWPGGAVKMVYGLREDGTVVCAALPSVNPDPESLQRKLAEELSGWRGICQLCVNEPLLGVREDGSVVFSETAHEDAETLRQMLSGWSNLELAGSVMTYDRIDLLGLTSEGQILEYRNNLGNAALDDMKNLEWIQVTHIVDDNLSAKTRNGRLLTCGLDFRMNYLLQWQIEQEKIQGLVGKEAVLCSDAAVYYEDASRNHWQDDAPELLETQVKEGVELWGGSYMHVKTCCYAFLHEDGTVTFRMTGDSITGTGIRPEQYYEQVRTAEDWTDIVQIAGKNGTLYGLKSDGTVLVAGQEKPLAADRKIIRIAANEGADFLSAVCGDGTARVLCSDEYDEIFGRTQLQSWKNITDIAAGESHVVGLRADGTVAAAGSNHCGQCDVGDWTDIVFITAGRNMTLGITKDGDLKMAGSLY